MKKLTKRAALLLALVVGVLGLFSGCTNKQAADDSWKKVEEAKKIVIGVDDEFPPMGFRDESGNIVGFDIDLANAVAEKLGIEADIRKINWDAKEMELSTGKIDAIWNGFTITPEREEKVLFSKPYLKSGQVIIVMKDSPIKTKADLAGKIVGLQNESSSEDALKSDEATYKSIGEDNIKKYLTNVEAFLDLEIGRVDAVIVDEVVAKYQATKSDGKMVVLEDSFAEESYGIGFRKEDKALCDKVQGALDSLVEEGTAKTISEKWFGSDIVEK
jgi:polar amino acid transport system substrate-binding protein